jgi:hypothetical protein
VRGAACSFFGIGIAAYELYRVYVYQHTGLAACLSARGGANPNPNPNPNPNHTGLAAYLSARGGGIDAVMHDAVGNRPPPRLLTLALAPAPAPALTPTPTLPLPYPLTLTPY